MTPGEEAAKLRAQADALEVVAELEAEFIAVQKVWLAAKTPENKVAYRAAAVALDAARTAHAEAVAGQGGNVTIMPGGIAMGGES